MGTYVSIAELDAVMNNDPDPKIVEVYPTLADADKTKLIAFAEDQIDNPNGFQWLGTPVTDGQATAFPREGMYDQASDFACYDDMPIQIQNIIVDADEETAPTPIKRAVIEIVRLCATFDDFYKFRQMQATAVDDFKVDVISFNFDLDRTWKKPLTRKAWAACRVLMVGYWTEANPNWLYRL